MQTAMNSASARRATPEPIRCGILAGEALAEGALAPDTPADRDAVVSHGFFARAADSVSAIPEALGVPEAFAAFPRQTHSSTAIAVESPWNPESVPQADALATNRCGIALCVATADCGPVLLADSKAGVIGAAHAGWRGAIGGILEAAVSLMESLGARRESIRAALGPTISQAHYEVGPEWIENLRKSDSGGERFLRASARSGFALFDLPGYILFRLERFGTRAVHCGNCTYAEEDRFFSHRRATHSSRKESGRQFSAIAMRGGG